MIALVAIVLPVFVVVGAGYLAVWRGLFSDAHVDGLMVFSTKFAIPCLLFSAIATLDLSRVFQPALLLTFYTGSTVGFFAGMMGARMLFGRPWPDCVAIGFTAMFANAVLLGLPITESAYGADAVAPNIAIIAIHAPFCYVLGIIAMEIVRADDMRPLGVAVQVGKAVFSNALMIGLILGFAVNLLNLPVPGIIEDALALMVRAALPAALFALGGILFRYKPEGDAAVIAFICAISLILHPAIAYTLGQTVSGLDQTQLRSAVMTAAMAPGVNGYIFANMYGAARRVVASSILVGTALSVLTAVAWIAVLP